MFKGLTVQYSTTFFENFLILCIPLILWVFITWSFVTQTSSTHTNLEKIEFSSIKSNSSLAACINCPSLVEYYASEIIQNISIDFDQPIEVLDQTITITLTTSADFYTTKTGWQPNYEYSARNQSNQITIYLQNGTDTIQNPDFYGLLIHEITHSMQYQYYGEPLTAVLPYWYLEGQAEYERYIQLYDQTYTVSDWNAQQSLTYQGWFEEFSDNLQIIGREKLYKAPFDIDEGQTLEEIILIK